MVADEAYKQLMEIKDRDVLSKSQDLRLTDWLDLMEEVRLYHEVMGALLLCIQQYFV